MLRDRLMKRAEAGDRQDTTSKIALYLLMHLEEIPSLSIYELAQRSFVAPATITRFSRELGYESFSDLKEACHEELARHSYYHRSHQIDGAAPPHYAAQLAEVYPSLEASVHQLSPRRVEALAKALVSYKYIYLFGSSFSSMMSQLIQTELYSYKKYCYPIHQVEELRAIATPRAETVILIFSMHGHLLQEVPAWETLAAQRSAFHCLFTQVPAFQTHPRAIYWGKCVNSTADYMSWMFVADQIVYEFKRQLN